MSTENVVVINDEDEDEKDLPSREECESRCQHFSDVTGEDSAMSMMCLQQSNWNIEVALNHYFSSKGSTSFNLASSQSGIKLLSWNIDGIDRDQHLQARTNAVCDIILREKPQIVFLQEVIEESESVIKRRLPNYTLVNAASAMYYTAALVLKDSVSLVKHDVLPFPTSVMGRNLLDVLCTVHGVPVRLLVSHLESTDSHKTERLKQLNYSLAEMKNTPPGITVLFGGDMNLKDREVEEMGKLPADIHDIWQVTGARPIARYTWDMTRNDNLPISFNRRNLKHRFDRLFTYFKPNTNGGSYLKPVYFELVGLERVKGCSCFPSDHWGILAHFDVTRTTEGPT